MTDHVKEALAWVSGLDEVLAAEGQTDATLVAAPLIAQVHATLALVEQQKIANQIAILGHMEAVALHAPGSSSHSKRMTLRTELRDRLGV